MIERLRSAVATAVRDLARLDVLDLVPRLTLLLLILFNGSFWALPTLLRILLVGALLYRPVYRSGWFWLAVTAALGYFHLERWYEIDNHKYLMTYWCLALAVALLLRGDDARRRQVLARNARLLIGLCMVFAVFWKLVSPDYLDGTFFRYALLVDSRFESVTTSVGGLEPEDAYRNDARLKSHFDGPSDGRASAEVELIDTPRLGWLADLLTWWTIGIELALALAFLLPDRWPPRVRLRHALLLLFVVTTYSLTPVIGFGWLLIIMALAHLPPEHQRLRLTYLVVLLLLVSYPDSWVDGVLDLLAPLFA